jgi:hypothetical protein
VPLFDGAYNNTHLFRCVTATQKVMLPLYSPPGHKAKLTKSAMIGIAFGVVIFGFIIAGIISGYMIKSRRQNQATALAYVIRR